MESDFQTRLRAARELRKLSQSELADKAGLQPSAISHFETGRRSPSFDNLKVLSEALLVTTDYLMGRVEDPGSTGTVIDRLNRQVGNLSSDDLETLSGFADMLVNKAADKKKG